MENSVENAQGQSNVEQANVTAKSSFLSKYATHIDSQAKTIAERKASSIEWFVPTNDETAYGIKFKGIIDDQVIFTEENSGGAVRLTTDFGKILSSFRNKGDNSEYYNFKDARKAVNLFRKVVAKYDAQYQLAFDSMASIHMKQHVYTDQLGYVYQGVSFDAHGNKVPNAMVWLTDDRLAMQEFIIELMTALSEEEKHPTFYAKLGKRSNGKSASAIVLSID